MKAEYINPFVTSTISTLEQFINDIEVDRGELAVQESPHSMQPTATYIGLSGELEGRVIYEMDRRTAVNIASAMNGEELPGMNEMVRSTIQELSNIISGNASTELTEGEDGKQVDISPPSLLIGGETEIDSNVGSEYLQIPLETNLGTISISLAIQES